METWLSRFEVMGYDEGTARMWARVRASREQIGRPLFAQDAWVAACALPHDAVLLTHNSDDAREYTRVPQYTV